MNTWPEIRKPLIILGAIITLDLVVKGWVTYTLPQGQQMELLGQALSIVQVRNIGVALGISGIELNLLGIAGILLKAVTAIFLVFIIKRSTVKELMIPPLMILAGWAGLLLDRLFFRNGQEGYRHMDYLYDGVFTDNVYNLSSLIVNTGWFLLILAIIIKFKTFRRIFKKSTAV